MNDGSAAGMLDCPASTPPNAYDMVRGLGLAHMDAALKANEGAAKLLRGETVPADQKVPIALVTKSAAGTH